MGLTGLALALYLPLALRALQGQPMNTFHYQALHWVYTTGMAFLLLALARFLAGTRLGAPLAFLGRYSLQIYLVHPMVIRLLERFPGFPEPLGAKPAFLLYGLLALGVPLLLAWFVVRVRISVALFGR